MNLKLVVPVAILILLAGGGSGYLLSRKTSSSSNTPGVTSGSKIVNTTTEVGSTDTKTFRDTATGTLEKGGINGDGTHKLIRDGGPSQTVYLTSSIVDLDQFEGKKVQIWGETVKGTKASWLMDVGRVKILE